MADQIAETGILPWVESQGGNERITLKVLRLGIEWLKGDFREKWKNAITDVIEGRSSKQTFEELADLQRALACYLFFVSQDRDALGVLERPVKEVLFGNSRDSVANCIGFERRGYVEGSLAGAISNLTFWQLIAESNPNLARRLDFEQMIVGGEADAKFAIDAVLDFGTMLNGKRVLRVVQIKSDRSGQVVVNPIYTNELKTSYLGGDVKGSDAQRMINGAKQLYPECHFLFFAVCIPSFDSPPVGNIFGIIRPEYPNRADLIGNFREQAFRSGLLPKIRK